MKCKNVDIVKFIEGEESEEAESHINECKKCKTESEKISKFIHIITTRYAEGKNLEEDLERELQALDISNMKRVPEGILKKAAALKEKNLSAKLKKIVGKGKKDIKEVVEGFMTPQMDAMPASPEDITKSKKKKKRAIKEDKKKKTE